MRTNAIIGIGLFACVIPLGAAAQGGTITIAPGATLVDSNTGTTHAIQLQASEFTNPGIGAVTLLLGGGGLQVCTTQSAHSDVPHTPFLGAVTIDIEFNRQAGGPGDGQLEITVHTPKRQIHLRAGSPAP